MEYDEELYDAAMSAALRIFRKAYKRSHHSVTRDIWDAEIPLEEEETHVLHHALSVLESMERPDGPAPEVDLPYLGGSLFDWEEERQRERNRRVREILDEIGPRRYETQEETLEHVERGIFAEQGRLEDRIEAVEQRTAATESAIGQNVFRRLAELEQKVAVGEARTHADRQEAIERLSRDEMWTQLQGYMSTVDKLKERVEVMQQRSARLQGRISDLEETTLHVEHHDRLRKRVRHLEQKLEIAEGRLSALDGQGISGDDSDG